MEVAVAGEEGVGGAFVSDAGAGEDAVEDDEGVIEDGGLAGGGGTGW